MSKNTEGDNYIKHAEKCMKTSLLKWSPDVDGAIEDYLKAAQCYKDAKNYDNAIKYFLIASEMQAKNDSLFYSAKSKEEAANIYREQKKYSQMTELVMQAGQTYRINGTADSATQMMQRMARSVENDAPGEGAKLYVQASQAAQDKDNLREAGEFAGLAAKLFVRSKDYESAQNALHSKLSLLTEVGDYHEAGKAVVCLVVLRLHDNDFVGASKVYSSAVEGHSFATTQDCGPVNELLCAVDQAEFDEARRILRGHTFVYLDNDFVRLARDIKFNESATRGVTEAVGDGGAVRYDDDDDIN